MKELTVVLGSMRRQWERGSFGQRCRYAEGEDLVGVFRRVILVPRQQLFIARRDMVTIAAIGWDLRPTNATLMHSSGYGQEMGFALYRYRPASVFALDEILTGEIWAARLDRLNDPFEPMMLTHVPSAVWEREAARLGSACFSTMRSSVSMWAYYASNHSGICLKYDVDVESWMKAAEDLKFALIKRGSERDTKKPIPLDQMIFKVEYARNLAKVDVRAVGESSLTAFSVDELRPFVTKSKDWEAEREFRIFALLDDPSIEGQAMPAPGRLTSVQLGVRCSGAMERLVRVALADRDDVVVERLKLSSHQFQLGRH